MLTSVVIGLEKRNFCPCDVGADGKHNSGGFREKFALFAMQHNFSLTMPFDCHYVDATNYLGTTLQQFNSEMFHLSDANLSNCITGNIYNLMYICLAIFRLYIGSLK